MFECHHPANAFTETIGTRRDANGHIVWKVDVGVEQWS